MYPACCRMLCLAFFSVILCVNLHAQPSESNEAGKDSLVSYVQQQFGLDQELYNGLLYYKQQVNYKGDPFFPMDSFYGGSVSIGGKEYDQLSLKYSAYSQSLVLEYTDYEGRYNQLELIGTRIDSFRLGAYSFKKLSLLSHEPMYYQEMKAGALTCYIHWRKDIHATSNDLTYSYEYTRSQGRFYIKYQGEIRSFTNRNSYLSVFPESSEQAIKKYFRQQRLSVKKASPEDILDLLIFTSQLTKSKAIQ